MPIDINNLREYKGGKPQKYREYQEKRFKDPAVIDKVIELDEQWRATSKFACNTIIMTWYE